MSTLARRASLVIGAFLLLAGAVGIGAQAMFWGKNFEVIYAATAWETALGFGLAPCSIALGMLLFSLGWFWPPEAQELHKRARVYVILSCCLLALCVLSAYLGGRWAWEYRAKLMQSNKVAPIRK